MSCLLDTLLGAERLAACERSDCPQVRASVARNRPDVLVFTVGNQVALEPQNPRADAWLRCHCCGAQHTDLGYVVTPEACHQVRLAAISDHLTFRS